MLGSVKYLFPVSINANYYKWRDLPVIVAWAEGTNELVGDVEWDGCAENDGGIEVDGAVLIDRADDSCKLG